MSTELDRRIKRNHDLDFGRPSKSLREPFWHLIQSLQMLNEIHPEGGIAEALDSAMEYLEHEDEINGWTVDYYV